jgi:murein DD-endopeptidase MepM/ murein hydrolase activator NlpD
MMTTWPVPKSYSREIPDLGEPGSFWEDRGDRNHCGIDIYAPGGSEVLAIEQGDVIDAGEQTSPDRVPYWNATMFLLVKTRSNLYCRYAELSDTRVSIGDRVLEGEVIGHVGEVIRPHQVDGCSPIYIQRLKMAGNTSMLHLELYRLRPGYSRAYSGGNWFGTGKPEGLLDPEHYLDGSA